MGSCLPARIRYVYGLSRIADLRESPSGQVTKVFLCPVVYYEHNRVDKNTLAEASVFCYYYVVIKAFRNKYKWILIFFLKLVF